MESDNNQPDGGTAPEGRARSFFDLSVYQDSAEEALEKHNIEKLLQFERYCRDRGMFDRQEACYADESRVRITWYDGDGKEFVRRSKEMASGRDADPYYLPAHKIYNTFVWLNGDKAVAEMQVMMFNYHRLDDADYNREGFARLLYRVQKEDGMWRIKGMDCIYERDFMLPVVPGCGRAFSEDDFAAYRDSYKCISYLFDRAGMPCSPEEAGDDRPQSVQRLYAEASDWLFA